jgi:formiminotetrahydrofolate cyclodeaminase
VTLATTPTTAFLDALASAAPTPGGGGAAAVMGAMGAALISMVAHLTLGKKGFEGVDAEMRALLADSEALRLRLTATVAEDAAAFDGLMLAYRRPKATEVEINERRDAIQQGLKLATLAPLQCARASAEGIRLAARAVERSNPQVISDVGVGVLASWSALQSAALNVRINVPQIKDRAFVDETQAELDALLAEGAALTEQVKARVQARMA